jgi:hypothetical protein
MGLQVNCLGIYWPWTGNTRLVKGLLTGHCTLRYQPYTKGLLVTPCAGNVESPYHTLLIPGFGLANNGDLWLCMVRVDTDTRRDTINIVLATALHSGLSRELQPGSEYTMDHII